MKKKLCSILLALTMVLTLLPVSALAEDGAGAGESAPAEAPVAETEYVAQIGAAKYKTLAGAVDAVPTDKTETEIVLLKDYIGSGIKVVAGKNIVFNLNGKTYTVDKPTVGSSGTETNGFQLLKDSKVTFKNGTLNSATGADCLPNGGILIQNYCDLTLENVTLDTSANSNISYVIINNFGSLTAKGNTVIKAADGKVAFDLWYGMNSEGLYDDGVSVTFGTDFTGSVTGKIEYGAHSRVTSKDWMNKAKLTIANGNFDTTFVDSNPREGIKSTDFNISISGGTFSDLSALDYLAAGANVTVKLAADTTKDVTIPVGTTVTLDLAGHKIVNSATAQDEKVADSSRKHTITNNGTLTILDSVGGGVVDNVSHGRAALYNAGTIVEIKGGKFTRSVDNSTDATSAKGNSWYVVYNAENATISKISSGEFLAVGKFSSLFCNCGLIGEITGGTFTQDGFIAFKNEGTVTKISGGTFSSKDESCIQNWGSIGEITGGTITAGSIGIWNFSSDEYNSVGTIGKISGGNISGSTAAIRLNDYDTSYLDPSKPSATNKANATVTGGNITGALQINTNTTLTVSGGTFTSDPSAYVAPGYVASYNGSTYTVYYPVPVIPNNNNNSSSTTTKNPDGSTTTTTTDKTTGTVTETTTTANGSVGTVKTGANGSTEISASISAADVKAAEQKNAPVIAPITVTPAASSAAAPIIKLSVPANAGEVAVAIPVVNAKQGTVAVKVNPDGTEEIIKTAVITENGLVLGVKGSMQIKVINNSKNFVDTVGHWAASDVDFVSARELFNGTAPALFSPEASVTRGMVVTVIARLAGENTDGGANWYDKGCAWAVANGVSDGTDPNGSITREQLAAMLYRYYGSPAASGSLSTYADAASVSAFGADAMQWCVNNGIINGMDGLLNPQGQATRAQVSAMFARYIRLAAAK